MNKLLLLQCLLGYQIVMSSRMLFYDAKRGNRVGRYFAWLAVLLGALIYSIV